MNFLRPLLLTILLLCATTISAAPPKESAPTKRGFGGSLSGALFTDASRTNLTKVGEAYRDR